MSERIKEVPVESIEPSPYQPRKRFDFDAIKSLAESIKRVGVIQPIVVREKKDNTYQIIAGERRLEALKLLHKKTAPVIVKNVSDIEAFKITLTENIQRENLNAVEIGMAISEMKEKFRITDKEIGEILGMSRSLVTNYLRILKLPDEIKKAIENGEISFGHAKSLAALPESEALKVFKKIVSKKLSVRETEQITKRERELTELEDALIRTLGTKVKITGNKNKGKINISYFSEDELISIIKKLLK